MISVFAVLAVSVFAQSDRYTAAMTREVSKIDSFSSSQQWLSSSNSFLRIAETEKTEWLPYYYAALGQVMHGFMSMGSAGNAEHSDPIADKAEEILNKAAALTEPNSELEIVRKMIANLRMMGDPMTRWQTYGAKGQEALEKAKKLSPENPRILLMEAQDKFYTPAEFGGGKDAAHKLFLAAKEKYASFKAQSPIHPNWGLTQVDYFLRQY